MDDTDLAFYSTEQLIDELMRRKTFLGLVIHADEELRHTRWQGDKVFKVHYNSNLGLEQASRLLETISESIQRDHC